MGTPYSPAPRHGLRVFLVLCCGLLTSVVLGAWIAPPGNAPLEAEEFNEHDLDNPSPVAEVVPGEVLVKLRPQQLGVHRQQLFEPLAAEVEFLAPFHGGGGFAPHGNPAPRSAAESMARLLLHPGISVEEALAHLNGNPAVEYAEPNYILRLAVVEPSTRTPDDFHFGQLWNLHNTGQSGGKPGADINALPAWAISTGDSRVVVAVIDTGIDYFHPDLESNIWLNPGEEEGSGTDDDQNGFVDDLRGFDFVSNDSHPFDDNHHGTHVAGIIGAKGDNRRGIPGVSWSVSLMALKAFDERGDSSTATVVKAIRYAIDNGAHIINASWGTSSHSRALEEIVSEAIAADILFVAAAGNSNTEAPFYPAALPGVLAVAATDHNDERARFSNFGAYVGVAAPGDIIFSTIPNNRYQAISGTSMAAPHVSGLAALIMAQHPEFTAAEVGNIIRNTADYLRGDRHLGAGRINAFAALRINQPLPWASLILPDEAQGPLLISAAAHGNEFVSYRLEFGKGPHPEQWRSFYLSRFPAQENHELQFSTADLDEGFYTFRLTAQNAFGGISTARAATTVRNVKLTSIAHNDILRPGTVIPIYGTVFGKDRAYTLEHGRGVEPKSWSQEGIELVTADRQPVNGLLAYWDTSLLEPDEFYSLKLIARDASGHVTEHLAHMIYFDSHFKPGWPLYLPIQGELPSAEWRQLAVADIDGDGRQEILLVDPGNAEGLPPVLQVFDSEGALRWSRSLSNSGPHLNVPVAGDLSGEGNHAIFADAGDKLFAFDPDGEPFPGQWPVSLEAGNLSKALADLTQDGHLELIGFSQENVGRHGTVYRQLSVWRHSGELLRRWELPSCGNTNEVLNLYPAVAKLKASPELAIIVPSGCSSISAFSLDSDAPVWAAQISGELISSPVVGDLTGNGELEIILAAAAPRGRSAGGGIYVFDSSGDLLPGWPVLLEETFHTSPALADLNGDGRLEIIVPSWSSQLLHVIQSDGFPTEGWPVSAGGLGAFRSSPVVADITGDGELNIVMAAPGRWSMAVRQTLKQIGGLRAWHADGQRVNLSPNPELEAFPMETSVGSWQKSPPPIITDLDNNGHLNIIGVSLQDRTYAPLGESNQRKNRSSIYVWELPAPMERQLMPWPSYRATPGNTGWYRPPPLPNIPPVLSHFPNQVIPPGGEFVPVPLEQYVLDPDHDLSELAWSFTGQHYLLLEISPSRQLLVRPPHENWTGRETIQLAVTDPAGGSDSMTVFFEVRPDYVPPVAATDQLVILEDTPALIEVLGNDSSPDGTPLRVTNLSQPLFGTASLNEDGTVAYLPDQDYFGEDSFTYAITSGSGGVAIGLVNITILPVNDPPTAVPDRVITDEDIPVTIDVLANDYDVDGDPIELVEFTQPSNGAALLLSSGLILYTPHPHYSGIDEFAYTISDPDGLTDTATVSILVKPVNKPPVAQDQHFTLNRNSSKTVTFLATDMDGDKLTYKVVDGPLHGELWAYPAVATYYPARGFAGDDRFTYLASDGLEESNLATVTFTVLEANNFPEAESLSLTNKPNQQLSITLAGSDLDDDPLTFSIVQPPAHGELTGSGSNYLYHPLPDFLGLDSFTFRAFDGQDFSPPATVKVTMTDVNTAPVTRPLWIQVFMDQPTELILRASDPENDPLTFSILTPPLYGQLTGEPPLLQYHPKPEFMGEDRFTFSASDGWLESKPSTVHISVVYPNHPPAATNQTVRLQPGTPEIIHLDVTDLDGDPLRTVILKGPRHGLISGIGAVLTYVPKAGFAGNDSFTYKAWDGFAYSNLGKVSLEVFTPSAPSPSPPSFETIETLPEGELRITLRVVPGTELLIETSTNLVDWTGFRRILPLEPVFTIDEDPEQASHRFYRLSTLPR